MTSTETLRPISIYRDDRDALIAIWDAQTAALLSLDVAYLHDPLCGDPAECGCPDLPNPVLSGLAEVFWVALVRVFGEARAAEILPAAHASGDLATELDRWSAVAR